MLLVGLCMGCLIGWTIHEHPTLQGVWLGNPGLAVTCEGVGGCHVSGRVLEGVLVEAPESPGTSHD